MLNKQELSFIIKTPRRNYLTHSNIFFFSWHDSPPVDLGLLLVHEDFCGF